MDLKYIVIFVGAGLVLNLAVLFQSWRRSMRSRDAMRRVLGK